MLNLPIYNLEKTKRNLYSCSFAISQTEYSGLYLTHYTWFFFLSRKLPMVMNQFKYVYIQSLLLVRYLE